ncbi:unnamed protein product [Schistocephalus solidus]|uniref:Endo/exonuclease/phosphatase domain-containing protein n=1 Tax=Schistocephalus solidus TaxID=70667 RepID=A0A183T625_SCHSO|nr:unnamed protein product [Schistocephalus solidus]
MALATRELARYKVDIAVLNETGFAEQGQLEDAAADYTFFWSGHIKAEQCDAGIVFAIQKDMVGRLPCLPHGINDRQISLRLPLPRDKFTTIISAYTSPPLRAPTKQSTFASRSCTSSWWLCHGDNNAHVGTDHATSYELTHRLDNLPVADGDRAVENRWCQSTALDFLGRTHHQQQDSFDDKNAAIHTLLTEKKHLHKAYGKHFNTQNLIPLPTPPPVLIATAHSPHASALSLTCESIAKYMRNHCLEHPATAKITASTALSALAHSLTGWAYSVTCASLTVDKIDNPCTPYTPDILTATDTATTNTMNDNPPALSISPAHTAPTTSPLPSACSVTCEPIARRLMNQCLGLQNTVSGPTSTALTAPAHSQTTWA